MEGNGISMGDLLAVLMGNRNNDGVFGGGGIGLFAIILIVVVMWLFTGGGMWNRGGESLTRAEMQQGFDTQSVINKLNGLENGLCDGFYSQNTTMLNGFAGVTSAVENARFAQQQCCCDTNRNIDAARYDAQKNTCDTINAVNAGVQRIIDSQNAARMADYQAQAMRDYIDKALCGVVRYPNGYTYNAGSSPFCGGSCGGY